MPLNLTNLLNSAPVSPPHSNYPNNNNTGPSPTELTLLLSSPETQQQNTATTTYLLNNKNKQTTTTSYQRPVLITSFSYDQHRHIHTGNNQFLSLKPLLSPPDLIGFNLANQIDQAIYQDESIDEALDGLLISLVDFVDNKTDPKDRLDHCRGILSAGLITWRGIMTKLCASVYESGRTGWTQEVMMVDGTVYMADVKEEQQQQEGSSREQTYYGHSYENLVTSPPGELPPVNTNVQWVAVVKANLNHTRIILGGEVDCVQSDAFNKLPLQTPSPPPILPHHFIEVKTAILPASDRDYYNLYRFKMLKFWLQSYLLGVPKIHVGMRDRSGIVRGVQEYMTLGIPGLVREAQRQTAAGGRWSAERSLGGGAGIVEFVMGRLRKDAAGGTATRQGRSEGRLREIVAAEADRQRGGGDAPGLLSDACRAQIATLHDWPVYQLVFRPPAKPGLPGSLQLFERPSRPASYKPFSNHLFGYAHPLLPPPDSDPAKLRIGFLPHLWIAHRVQSRVLLALEAGPNPTS